MGQLKTELKFSLMEIVVEYILQTPVCSFSKERKNSRHEESLQCPSPQLSFVHFLFPQVPSDPQHLTFNRSSSFLLRRGLGGGRENGEPGDSITVTFLQSCMVQANPSMGPICKLERIIYNLPNFFRIKSNSQFL